MPSHLFAQQWKEMSTFRSMFCSEYQTGHKIQTIWFWDAWYFCKGIHDSVFYEHLLSVTVELETKCCITHGCHPYIVSAPQFYDIINGTLMCYVSVDVFLMQDGKCVNEPDMTVRVPFIQLRSKLSPFCYVQVYRRLICCVTGPEMHTQFW